MPTMTPEQWAAVIAATGLPFIIKELFSGWRASRSGRAEQEKYRNRTLMDQAARAESRRDAAEARREAAESRADDEAEKRRVWEDYAADLRWRLMTCPDCRANVPPWPDVD